jgi:hypothetical protein
VEDDCAVLKTTSTTPFVSRQLAVGNFLAFITAPADGLPAITHRSRTGPANRLRLRPVSYPLLGVRQSMRAPSDLCSPALDARDIDGFHNIPRLCSWVCMFQNMIPCSERRSVQGELILQSLRRSAEHNSRTRWTSGRTADLPSTPTIPQENGARCRLRQPQAMDSEPPVGGGFGPLPS